MFCYQCEQNQKGGCHTQQGVCGKDETTAQLQDVLIHAAKGVSFFTHQISGDKTEYNAFVLEALFTTVTNVNFDSERIMPFIEKAYELKERAKTEFLKNNSIDAKLLTDLLHPINFVYNSDLNEMAEFGKKVSITARKFLRGADVAGVEEMALYGLKGLAAYAEHAKVINYTDDKIFADIQEAMYKLCTELTLEELLGLSLKVGEINLRVMELLDRAHNDTFGHPEPTKVRTTGLKGKAILVSGHDLQDLKELLVQTEGKGINIYTHGEMLPGLAYPELKKYSHLVGNWGGAWQDQIKEFEEFPGAILMTTNCIQKPKETYKARIFTSGLVAWPGVQHIADKNFAPVIEAALAAPGFQADEPEHYTMTGFAHNAVLGVADKVIDAVKAGQIKHFFLIGGCDGAKSGRNYYTDFAVKAPQDTVILTLACGKFRFNKLEFGDIGGIPRLLDVGQCNDAYSAIKIAVALAEAFGTDVNSLPLSLILSWYEQKAVAILLTLLHLGIKNIRIGPSLPAFIEPNVLQILVDLFNIKPIGEVDADIADCMQRA